jgi:predicted dehydrogenase
MVNRGAMVQNKIKVSFIGAGNMASEHIKCFLDIENVKLGGIHSRTRSKAEVLASTFSIPMVCDSIKELYENTQSDLVIISVSELSVREICMEAFQYPWVCLIEKPAGYNFEDASIVAKEAELRNCQAFVALNRRHYSSTKSVLEDLVGNNAKRLIHIYDQEDIIIARNMGTPPLVIENWMYANSIHVIDYLKTFGRGEVVSVEPIIRWNSEAPDFVSAKICFSSGDIGLYEAVWNGPGPWAVTVTTQEKRWELRPLEKAIYQLNGSRKLEIIESHEWDSHFKPGLRAQANEAIKATLGKPHSLPTVNDALGTMRLVKEIYS